MTTDQFEVRHFRQAYIMDNKWHISMGPYGYCELEKDTSKLTYYMRSNPDPIVVIDCGIKIDPSTEEVSFSHIRDVSCIRIVVKINDTMKYFNIDKETRVFSEVFLPTE